MYNYYYIIINIIYYYYVLPMLMQMDVAESQFNRTMYRYGNNTATNEIVDFYQTSVSVCVDAMGESLSMYFEI